MNDENLNKLGIEKSDKGMKYLVHINYLDYSLTEIIDSFALKLIQLEQAVEKLQEERRQE